MPERILDMATLNDLFGDIGDETLIELIHAFLDEMDERVDRLTQGISTLDNKLVKHEAHALKSSAKAFGALKLSSIARRLEAAGGLGEVGQIDDQDRQIKQVAIATRAEFEAKVLHAQPLDLS
jgi:HPt (histidine-containing phosphotransfer) domain-containing protein